MKFIFSVIFLFPEIEFKVFLVIISCLSVFYLECSCTLDEDVFASMRSDINKKSEGKKSLSGQNLPDCKR